ncbi:MAG: hypothetical protein ABI308_09330 [Mucilaginibacter sp.]
MGNLSTAQALQVVAILQDLADALSGYVISNQAQLAAADKEAIMVSQEKIVDLANRMTDQAADLVFEDVDQQLTQLETINKGVAQQLQALGDVQKVISLAADLLTLAVAISTFKPGDIASSAGDILNQLDIKIG